MRALLGLVVLATAATVLVGRSLATAITENAAHATSGRRPHMCAVAIPVGGVPTDVVAAPDAVWVATGGLVRRSTVPLPAMPRLACEPVRTPRRT
jgi:hypothetical protein